MSTETPRPQPGGSPVAPRKICIVGAGSIGGLLGVELSRQGHHVSFLARGAHLAAMQANNALKLVKLDGSTVESAPNSRFISSLDEIDTQDVVILGLKMHQIASVVHDLSRILAEHTVIVTTQNGIPWWYFQQNRQITHMHERTVESVDPGGVLKNSIDARRIIASVVYPAAHVGAPGVIVHTEGVRFPVGELSGENTHRVQMVSAMLVQAGFKSPVLDDVRGELWLKLWGTVAVNPLSALTHATLGHLCAPGPGRDVVVRLMKEVESVVAKLGARLRVPLEKRVDGAMRVGDHKTSMLQDCENGKVMEIDTIMGAVVELARVCQVDTPCIDTIYGTIRMLAAVMEKERAKVVLVGLEGL